MPGIIFGLKEVIYLLKHPGCWFLWVSPTHTWSSPTSGFFLAIAKKDLLSRFPEIAQSRTRKTQVHWSMLLAKGYNILSSPCFCLHWLTLFIPYATKPVQVSIIYCILAFHSFGKPSQLLFPVPTPLFCTCSMEENVSSGFLQGLFNQGDYKTSVKHFSYNPELNHPLSEKNFQALLQFKAKAISLACVQPRVILLSKVQRKQRVWYVVKTGTFFQAWISGNN